MAMAAESESLVRKEKTISPMWTYFSLEPDEKGKRKNKDEAVCKICHSKVPTKDGNTTSLFNHLKPQHPSKYSSVTQVATAKKVAQKHKPVHNRAQPTLESTLDKAKLYERNGHKWQELTDSVTRYICKDIMPLYGVEKEGFRSMLRKFNPLYELPSRKFFTHADSSTFALQLPAHLQKEFLVPVDSQ